LRGERVELRKNASTAATGQPMAKALSQRGTKRFKAGAHFGKDFLSLTKSPATGVEASLKKLLAFLRV